MPPTVKMYFFFFLEKLLIFTDRNIRIGASGRIGGQRIVSHEGNGFFRSVLR